MRIAYLVPGPAGPFFEKNSLREQMLVAELRWCGHDVLLLPLLFPLTLGLDPRSPTEAIPLFGGAVRVYSHHCHPFLANYVPEWIWKRLDTPGLRRRIAKHVLGSPRRFTEFMKDALDGRNGPLVVEMQNLCAWLARQRKPDVVVLSTPFLLGMAPLIKRNVCVPVSCAMHSEFEDLSLLRGPEAIILLTKLRSLIGEVDGFLPVSHFHAARIQSRLGIPEAAIRTVHPGIDCSRSEWVPPPSLPTVGLVVRGDPVDAELDIVSAVASLRQSGVDGNAAIHIAIEPRPLRQANTSTRRLYACGKVETLPHAEEKLRSFLQAFSVLVFIHSQPLPAFDDLVLEALALGVPVILPDNGANAEFAAFSKAVFLYRDIASMAQMVHDLLARGTVETETLRAEARHSVEHCFSMPRMAQETAEALQLTITRSSPRLEAWATRPSTR